MNLGVSHVCVCFDYFRVKNSGLMCICVGGHRVHDGYLSSSGAKLYRTGLTFGKRKARRYNRMLILSFINRCENKLSHLPARFQTFMHTPCIYCQVRKIKNASYMNKF